MIVRNEAHIVGEALDAVARYISSWVIVDTGSKDGTQELIRRHMAGLGIPGVLHERPWRDFGYNRSEALRLAQGHGDYVWVMDADDVVAGVPDFAGLSADVYQLRYRRTAYGLTYWRRQVFRDGLGWRYEGVVHEYAVCDSPFAEERLDGDYFVESRRLGARSLDPQKFARDRDLLLAEVERNPDDGRSVFYLAQSYFDLGDFVNARAWYERRVAMGGWQEEVFCAMYRVAVTMSNLDAPWVEIQDAYLRAWEFRPTRAEPLFALARRYRREQRYRLGYLFAAQAAQLPPPDGEVSFVGADIYAWRAADEQAVCASWLGKHLEAFELCRRVLARPDLPAEDRLRIAANRDGCAPAMIDEAARYPGALVRNLGNRDRDDRSDRNDHAVCVSLVAGPDADAAALALNSFLRCCADLVRVGRFLVVDAGLPATGQATLLQHYPFLEFVELTQLCARIGSRFWLHLGRGWRFFAPERYVARLIAVLEAEPEVFQVGINVADAATLTGVSEAEGGVRRAADGGRYVLADAAATGPAMYDIARLDRAGITGFDSADPDPVVALGRRAAAAGLRTASLDEVLCIAATA